MNEVNLGGWLLLLSRLLIVWQPLILAIEASSALEALSLRGVPLLLLLIARLMVTGVGVGAGIALTRRRAGAVAITKASLLLSAATDLFVYATPYWPNNRIPGDTVLYVLWTLAYNGGWLVYLMRSRRVRETFA